MKTSKAIVYMMEENAILETLENLKFKSSSTSLNKAEVKAVKTLYDVYIELFNETDILKDIMFNRRSLGWRLVLKQAKVV